MELTDQLQQLGLSKYETEAYCTLLERGPLTGYEVGKHSQVPLSRSYEILERLTQKGFALLQPGEPPRYRACEPRFILDRFRSSMEQTLTTLASSLETLAQPDVSGEIWVVRGHDNILAHAKDLLTSCTATLDISAPPAYENALSSFLIAIHKQGCTLFRAENVSREGMSATSLLLLADNRKALIGTLSPTGSCQAIVSSQNALLEVLRGYFAYARQQALVTSVPVESLASSSTAESGDWLTWEQRKHRHLKNLSNERRIA
jgi:predicted transcriptional regulator